MSTATFAFTSSQPHSRRAARRAGLLPQAITSAHALPVAATSGGSLLDLAHGGSPRPKGRQALLLVAGVLALHAGVLLWIKTHPAPPVQVLATPPVAVELAAPPVPVEPPKPVVVPPKHLLTPPPPPPPAATPHIDQPPPPPTTAPLPTAEPQAPVVQAAPIAPPTPPAPAPVAKPATPTVDSVAYLNHPAPDYPEFAVEQGWEGTALLTVLVLANGHVGHVELKHSSGHKVLDKIAADTVLQRYTFHPYVRDGIAMDVLTDVPIIFKLAN